MLFSNILWLANIEMKRKRSVSQASVCFTIKARVSFFKSTVWPVALHCRRPFIQVKWIPWKNKTKNVMSWKYLWVVFFLNIRTSFDIGRFSQTFTHASPHKANATQHEAQIKTSDSSSYSQAEMTLWCSYWTLQNSPLLFTSAIFIFCYPRCICPPSLSRSPQFSPLLRGVSALWVASTASPHCVNTKTKRCVCVCVCQPLVNEGSESLRIHPHPSPTLSVLLHLIPPSFPH